MIVYPTKITLIDGKKDPSKRYCKVNYVTSDGTTGEAFYEAKGEIPIAEIPIKELTQKLRGYDLQFQPSLDGKEFRVSGMIKVVR